MYDDFVAERLAHLRSMKKVSARDMSLSLGLDKSYINNVENKRAMPSMKQFHAICEYLGVTPKQFYDDNQNYPQKIAAIVNNLNKLSEDSLDRVGGIVEDLADKK